MPIYEYRCQSCGHELEKLQRIADPVLKKCPACGKQRLRRLISAAGFRLKGGGWYETDFKQGNKRNLADGEGGRAEADKPAKKEPAAGDAPATATSKGDAGNTGATASS